MKKNWQNPEMESLELNATAQKLVGNKYDGGYIGDGHIGLLEWNGGENPSEPGDS